MNVCSGGFLGTSWGFIYKIDPQNAPELFDTKNQDQGLVFEFEMSFEQ